MAIMIINSQQSLNEAIVQLKKDFDQCKYLELDIKAKGKARTLKQNAALHMFLTNLASALNDAGLDMKRTLKHEVDIPWSMPMAKEYLWKPMQKVVTGQESTAKVKTVDYPLIYETLNRYMSDKFGISVQWPTG